MTPHGVNIAGDKLIYIYNIYIYICFWVNQFLGCLTAVS